MEQDARFENKLDADGSCPHNVFGGVACAFCVNDARLRERSEYNAWVIKATARRIRERIEAEGIDDTAGIMAVLNSVERDGQT